jgi:hypothetical protein
MRRAAWIGGAFLAGVCLLTALLAWIVPDERDRRGPVSDTEAACMAADLSPAARARIRCN